MEKVAFALVAALVIGFVASRDWGCQGSGCGGKQPNKEDTSRVEYQKAVAAYEAQQAKALQSWNYSEIPDKMTSKPIKLAKVQSSNEIRFGSPYDGLQRATLKLRVHPRFGKDVILSIERGQFNCGVDECSVVVRFDEGKASTFSVAEAEDNSHNTLFIKNHDRFVAAARKAQRVVIEAQFFREGNRTLEFDVQGLNW